MEHTHRTARQAGCARLYNYQKFCPERLSTTLREQKVHCSNPANLNDPWDCKPFYDARAIREPQDIERLIIWARNIADPPLLPDQEADLRRRLHTDPGFRGIFVDGFSQCNLAVIRPRRILPHA